MEEMKIDFNELQQQQEETIKKEGKYGEVKIIIGRGIMENPEQQVCNIQLNGISTKEVAIMIVTLKSVMKKLIETYPMAGILASTMEAKGICYDGKTNEVNGIIEV